MVIEQMEDLLAKMRIEYSEASPERKMEIKDRAEKIKRAKELIEAYQSKTKKIIEVAREPLETVPIEEVEDIFGIKN